MTRRQLGDVLGRALSDTGNDLDKAAWILVTVDRQRRSQRTHRLIAKGGAKIASRSSGAPLFDASPLGQVAHEVAARRGLTDRQLLSGTTREAYNARQEAYWAMRQLTPRPSYPAIGAFFGGLNHTTVIHGARQHQARLDAARGGERDEATGP